MKFTLLTIVDNSVIKINANRLLEAKLNFNLNIANIPKTIINALINILKTEPKEVLGP